MEGLEVGQLVILLFIAVDIAFTVAVGIVLENHIDNLKMKIRRDTNEDVD
jgi:hypothetical protein